jgi:hypothetical protein
MGLISIDQAEGNNAPPTEETLPTKKLYTIDEAERIQETPIAPTASELGNPAWRFAMGVGEGAATQLRKLPAQAMFMLGEAMVKETPQYKAEHQRIVDGKPDGLYNGPQTDFIDNMNYDFGNRLRKLAIKNLNVIDQQNKETFKPHQEGSVFKIGAEGRDVAGDLGQGAVSLGAALLAGVASEGAAVPAILFGGMQAASKYEDMRLTGTPADDTPANKKPMDMERAQQFAAAYGIVEGGLEFVGIEKMLKLGDHFGQAAIKAGMTEFTQEFSQGFGERVLDTMSGQRTVTNLHDAWQLIGEASYEGALGSILGSTMSVPMTMHTRNTMRQNLETMGVSKKESGKVADVMLHKAQTDVLTFLEKHADVKSSYKGIHDEVYPMALDALKNTNMSEDERAAVAASVARVQGVQAVAEASKRGVTPEEYYKGLGLKIAAGEDGTTVSVSTNPDVLNQAMDKELNPNERIGIVDLNKDNVHGTKEDLKGYIRDLTKDGPVRIEKQDAGMVIAVVKEKADHLGGTFVPRALTHIKNASIRSIIELIQNSVKVETSANKNIKRPNVQQYHRFYTPVRLGNEVHVVRIVVEEMKDGRAFVNLSGEKSMAHSLIVEGDKTGAKNEKHQSPPTVGDNSPSSEFLAVKTSASDLSIGEMLSGVKDADGLPYIADQTLQQSSGDAVKAQVHITPDAAVMAVFKNADASSIPHELAHVWLADMMKFVQSGQASEKYKADWKDLESFLGIKAGQTQFSREQQEKFAKTFEAYIYEGKSPSKGLQRHFADYKRWMKKAYESIDEIGAEVSPEARRYLDSMFMLDEEYARNREMEAVAPNFVAQDFGRQFAAGFIPLSTRLGKVHETLRDAIRKFEFGVLKSTMDDLLIAKPFLEKFDKLNKQDWKDLDLALKNREVSVIDEIVDRNGMRKEYDAVVQLYKDIHHRASVVGMDIGHIDNYFARKVVNPEALMGYLRGTRDWSKVSESIASENTRRKSIGDPVMTIEEEANFVSSMIRGYGGEQIKVSKTTHSKTRKLDKLDAVMNQYYKPSTTALHEYIGSMNNAIAAREFFGIKNSNVDEHIGVYVKELVDRGLIDHQQEAEVQSILKARFSAKGATAFFAAYKNIAYIATMGSPLSAITQIQDLAYSFYANGFFHTVAGAADTFSGKGLKKQDMGVDVIAEEFTDKSKLSQAVAHTFNLIGLTKMDAIGKEALINGALRRMSREALKNDPKLTAMLDRVFGADAQRVKAELAGMQATDDVKYLLFAELSKFQPISLSEMPEGYVTGGNGRLLYMLKSYTIKQLDAFHNECFTKMGNPATRVEGYQNLVRLAFLLAILGAGTDVIKNWLLRRPTTLNDIVIDNMLRLMGVSKWTVYQFKSGPLTSLYKGIAPPMIFDDPFTDTWKYVTERMDDKDEPLELKDVKSANYIPLIGKLYYWWFGGGAAISDEKRLKMEE